MGVDLKRLMDPGTAVSKAAEALGMTGGIDAFKGRAEPVAALASAIMIREGLVALARVLNAQGDEITDDLGADADDAACRG